LRALAAIGILQEGKDARFALSPLGRGLAPTAHGSLNAWANSSDRGLYGLPGVS
jgi:hypothetical protein